MSGANPSESEDRPEDGAPAAAGTEERELLGRLRSGDEAAFEALVAQHGGWMLALARRILRDDEEARDAVQEAFLLAFRALDRFEGQSRLGTWLHRIVVNAALMRLRRRRSRPEESIEPFLPTFHADGHSATVYGDWPEIADEILDRKENAELVRRTIDSLPETYRTVLLLRDLEELETAETAELLGVTANAVKIRLHRARQALREKLDPVMKRGFA